MIDNFLKLFTLNKYYTDKIMDKGIESSLDKLEKVPVVQIGLTKNILHDLSLLTRWYTVGLEPREGLRYGLKSGKHIPAIGKYIHYNYGRGRLTDLKRQLEKYKEIRKEQTTNNR